MTIRFDSAGGVPKPQALNNTKPDPQEGTNKPAFGDILNESTQKAETNETGHLRSEAAGIIALHRKQILNPESLVATSAQQQTFSLVRSGDDNSSE